MEHKENLRPESALLLLGALHAGEKAGWKMKGVEQDRISDEGFSAALSAKNPNSRMELASQRSKVGMAAAGTPKAGILMNAAALATLLSAVSKNLGPPVPEMVATSLLIILDPINGIVSQDKDTSIECLARAFAINEAMRKSSASIPVS